MELKSAEEIQSSYLKDREGQDSGWPVENLQEPPHISQAGFMADLTSLGELPGLVNTDDEVN